MSVNNQININWKGLEAILAKIGIKPEHLYLASILASIPTPTLNYLATEIETLGEFFSSQGFIEFGKCLKNVAEGLREYIIVREESNKLDQRDILKLANYYNSDLKRKLEEFGKMAEKSMTNLYRAISECPYVSGFLWRITELINPNHNRYRQ